MSGNSAVESHLPNADSDTASELLVAELVLNDIATAQARPKYRSLFGFRTHRTDAELALDLQETSLRALVEVLHDHQFASSIDRAIRSDAPQLGRLWVQERAEWDDHQAAVALGEGRDMPQQTLSQRMLEQGSSSTAARPAREPRFARRAHASESTEESVDVINQDMDNVHITTPGTLETVPKNRDPGLECVICTDTVSPSRSFKAPCVHRYCRGCIINLVETCLRDESLFPLRCCHQVLPLASVFEFISTSLRLQFLAKGREYSVPAQSRVYCSNPRCSTFLDASGDRRRDLTCDVCDTISCSHCKNNAHPGEDCSEHQSTLQLRQTATENKWQTCPGCHAIVELSQGCYHMTCRCSAQFCYLCSAPWKTCGCERWDEARLLGDADRRVRNEFGNRLAEAQPAVHAERVYRRMAVLREDHECEAHIWKYRHGCGTCEQCGDFLRVFLMRCTYCQTLVCRRCSVNRL